MEIVGVQVFNRKRWLIAAIAVLILLFAGYVNRTALERGVICFGLRFPVCFIGA